MFEKEIEKCSRCALCQEVCPLYKMDGNECSVSRGKLLQLKGVSLNHLKYSKKIDDNLNFCLNCGRCIKFCPSNIDVLKLFAHFKFKNLTFLKKIFSSQFVFNLKTLSFLKIRKKEKKVLHFFGCMSLFKNDFACCGLPYLTKGRLDIFENLMKKNVEIIENDEVERVIFSCATCFETFKNYENLSENAKKKLIFKPFSDIKFPKTPFTFHKPCHLDENIYSEIEEKLREYENYIPLETQSCCGFGGDFFLLHPIVSTKLAIKKAKEIEKSGAKKVITCCPVCKIGLFWGKFALLIFHLLGFKK